MVEKDLTLQIFKLQVGQHIRQDKLIEELVRLRYHEEKQVAEPGEFSVRGATIDLYPLSYRAPIRVYFQLDEVESIRDYSLHEGKSLTTFEELFVLPITEAFLRRRSRLKSYLEEFEPGS